MYLRDRTANNIAVPRSAIAPWVDWGWIARALGHIYYQPSVTGPGRVTRGKRVLAKRNGYTGDVEVEVEVVAAWLTPRVRLSLLAFEFYQSYQQPHNAASTLGRRAKMRGITACCCLYKPAPARLLTLSPRTDSSDIRTPQLLRYYSVLTYTLTSCRDESSGGSEDPLQDGRT